MTIKIYFFAMLFIAEALFVHISHSVTCDNSSATLIILSIMEVLHVLKVQEVCVFQRLSL